MTGWIIAFAVIFLLAILPLGASVIYDADGPLVRIIAGPIRLTVFPMKKKAKKPDKAEKKGDKPSEEQQQKKTEKEKKKEKPDKKKDSKKKESKGGSVTDFLPLVGVALDFLNDFRRKIRIDKLYLKLILAGGDPCDLALNYGRAWEAVGNLMPNLERWLVIKDRDIQVECDFEAEAMTVSARLDLTITLGRIISLVFWYAIRALWEFIKILNKRKGGAST